jgi:hypothetical protein
MRRFYATGRRRIVLGLGSLLVVGLLTLGNLWLSSSATAGDDKLPLPDVKKEDGAKKAPKTDLLDLPPAHTPKATETLPTPPATGGSVGISEEHSGGIPGLPPTNTKDVPETSPKPPPVSGIAPDATPEPTGPVKPAVGESRVPPVAGTPASPPAPGTPPSPLPGVPTTPPSVEKPLPPPGVQTLISPPPPGIGVTTPSPSTSSDSNDIKQLMTQLNEIRAERGRLYEREKQTVEQIKKRFLEQRKALQQIEREMRALGVTPEDVPEDVTAPTPAPPVRPVRY